MHPLHAMQWCTTADPLVCRRIAGFISQQLLKAAAHLAVALVCAVLWLAHNRRLERGPSLRQKAHASDVALPSMIDLEARASGGPYHSGARVHTPRGPWVWHPGLKRLLVSSACLPACVATLLLLLAGHLASSPLCTHLHACN